MVSVTNLTKKTVPKSTCKKLAAKILGEKYDLSIVFAGGKRMQSLNNAYRKKNKPADTLSFIYGKSEGEVFLNAGKPRERLIFLAIHSVLHLKGLMHGEKMEKLEKKYYNEFHNGERNRYDN